MQLLSWLHEIFDASVLKQGPILHGDKFVFICIECIKCNSNAVMDEHISKKIWFVMFESVIYDDVILNFCAMCYALPVQNVQTIYLIYAR